jgi:hypothetical protein
MIDITQGYDDVESNQGQEFMEVPRGQHVFRIAAIQRKQTFDSGSQKVTLRCTVDEGPYKGLNLFHDLFITPSTLEGPKGEQRERTEEELNEAVRKTQGRVKGFLKSCDAPLRNETSLSPGDDGFAFEFFGIDGLVNCRFMGDVIQKMDQYKGEKAAQITRTDPLSDPKKGIDNWVNNVLPRLNAEGSGSGSNGVAQAL